jgi:hypothetical protein
LLKETCPPEEIPSLSEAVAQLTELATSIVTAELHEHFTAFAEQYLSRATDHRTGPSNT